MKAVLVLARDWRVPAGFCSAERGSAVCREGLQLPMLSTGLAGVLGWPKPCRVSGAGRAVQGCAGGVSGDRARLLGP